MKVYIQWAKSAAEDWTAYDIRSNADVRRLTRKPVPKGGEKLDVEPGWYVGLNCQGVDFTGYDHVAIETVVQTGEHGLRITGWSDDPEDTDERHACEFTLLDPAPDRHLPLGAEHGDWKRDNPKRWRLADDGRPYKLNTRQVRRQWVNHVVTDRLTPEDVAHHGLRPWEEFTPPSADLTLHGIWVSDDLFEDHVRARGTHGWHEWCDV